MADKPVFHGGAVVPSSAHKDYHQRAIQIHGRPKFEGISAHQAITPHYTPLREDAKPRDAFVACLWHSRTGLIDALNSGAPCLHSFKAYPPGVLGAAAISTQQPS